MKHDLLYEKYKDVFKDVPKGKLCVPLTGGLDSRVLAHFLPHIDLSFYIYTQRTYKNLNIVQKLWDHFKVDKTYPIYITDSFETAADALKLSGDVRRWWLIAGLNKLSKKIDLTDYTICINEHSDFYTGLHLKLRHKSYENYYINNVIPQHNKTFSDTFNNYFGNYWAPTIEGDFFIWCLNNLNYFDKFMQRTYRKMIKKYMPELYHIPRCFETGKPISLDKNYTMYRLLNYFNKTSNFN